MVSIRRRRYLGLCSGRSSFLVDIPKPTENGKAVENPALNIKSFSVHPLPPVNLDFQAPVNNSEVLPGSSSASGSSLLKEEPDPYYPGYFYSEVFPCVDEKREEILALRRSGKEIKRRKRHRRKHYEDQEPCLMRGVYFKNMKWQAAIKVDKKQIHLGTVASQEEAARLYDRAAFMCGREPNFELPEEEKHELRSYKWEDFLAMTRNAINTKKHQRKLGMGRRKKPETQLQSDEEHERGTGGSSLSEDGDVDTSAS